MKRTTAFIAWTALFTLLAPSCLGTDVGNPTDGEAKVEVSFTGYEEANPGALTLASDVTIDEAWLVFERVRFHHSSRCGVDGPEDNREAAVVDLLEEGSTGLALRPKDAGNYCRLELKLGKLDTGELPPDAPADLADRSVLVRGERADGTPFELRADFGERLGLNARDDSFALDAGVEKLFVGFALDKWIEAEELDAIDGDDPIVIDDSHHPDLLDTFRDELPLSSRLFRDADEDGTLDADERDEALAEGVEESGDEGSDEVDDAGTDERGSPLDASEEDEDAADEEDDAGEEEDVVEEEDGH